MVAVGIPERHFVKTCQGRSGRERVHKVLLLFIVPSIEGVINEVMMLNFIKMIIIKSWHRFLLLLRCKNGRHAMTMSMVGSDAVWRQRRRHVGEIVTVVKVFINGSARSGLATHRTKLWSLLVVVVRRRSPKR